MIVVDTSALATILFEEPDWQLCRDVLDTAAKVVMSAGTLQEALIVALKRDSQAEMALLIRLLGIEIISVNAALAHLAGQAYRHYGKGFHAASLNYGDCFAYVLAKELNCPLLFIGNDFSRTDIVSALGQS